MIYAGFLTGLLSVWISCVSATCDSVLTRMCSDLDKMTAGNTLK